MDTPPSNDSLKASLSPPVGSCLRQKRLASKQMFRQCVKHYHQWLCSSIRLKTKVGLNPPGLFRLQGPPKRTSCVLLYPGSSVKEPNRKGGKCKISRVLQSPVSSPQASLKVEASNRPKRDQHFSTGRKVQKWKLQSPSGPL